MKRNSLPVILFAVMAGTALPCIADDAAATKFHAILAQGREAGTILEGSTSADGQLAVLFTSGKKSAKPADWPTLVPGVIIGQTEATDEALYQTGNWVVSLSDKKKLGRVRSTNPDFSAVYSDFQLNAGLLGNGFSALWGPGQEGWHYGILNYKARWGCGDIFLVNSDGTEAKITSIRKVLESASRKFIAPKIPKGNTASDFVVGYDLLGVDHPENSSSVGDPLQMRIGFIAEVPKSDDADVFEGTLTVVLSRDDKGDATAKVTNITMGPADQVPTSSTPEQGTSKNAPSAKDFEAFRAEWNAKAKAGDWKMVRKNLPAREKGRKEFVGGWLEGTILQRLVHVDSIDDKNESITLYFWRDGQLTSVYQFRTGAMAQISDVNEATETYNFVDEKLVGWHRTGDSATDVDPGEVGFQDQGKEILRDSIRLSEPVYQEIGAD